MISSNAIGSKLRTRISKNQFDSIKRELETYKLEKFSDHFPEKIFDTEQKSVQKTKHREYKLKQRTGNESRKDTIKNIIESCILHSNTEADFAKILKTQGLEFYRRGKSQTPGVIDISSGKRYRLKTLGLDKLILKFDRAEELEKLKIRQNSVKRDLI